MNSKYQIPRAKTPESVGVSSAVVREFLDGMAQAGLEYHSLMVIRHGQVGVEFFNKPFRAASPHAMYSVSKTWTATAIGFAVDEGLISLDTKVVDLFPEHRPEKADANLDRLTVKHLLTMSSGKNINLLEDKSRIDWMSQFFKSPWNFEPGNKFVYVNENIYMLAAIIKRVSGLSVRQYLTPRLFDPMGMEVPFWETDAGGVEAGGWGLYAKTEDLAKLMLCYAQAGQLHGQQIIPAWWAKEAAILQADNSGSAAKDCGAGYGYCIWRCSSAPNAYRADGMFSQFGIVLEDYDAVITVTAAVTMEQDALDYLFRFFPRAFFDATKETRETPAGWSKYLRSFSIDKPQKSTHSHWEEKLKGKTILVSNKKYLQTIGFPFSIMPIAVTYMTTDKAGNPDKFQLAFTEGMMKIRWTEGDEINTVYCGMDGKMRGGKITLGQIDYDVCAYAQWVSDTVLEIHIRPYTTVAKRILRFEFEEGGRVNIIPSSTPDVNSIAQTLGFSAGDLIKNENLLRLVPPFLAILSKAIEPRLKGRIL